MDGVNFGRWTHSRSHKFATGPGGYQPVHIHANAEFVTDWLE